MPPGGIPATWFAGDLVCRRVGLQASWFVDDLGSAESPPPQTPSTTGDCRRDGPGGAMMPIRAVSHGRRGDNVALEELHRRITAGTVGAAAQAAGQINYLTIRYIVTPNPVGQTIDLTGVTNLVVEGTTTAPHASAAVWKKAPEQVNPLQTPAPILAKV
jgi:hypothetical protein